MKRISTWGIIGLTPLLIFSAQGIWLRAKLNSIGCINLSVTQSQTEVCDKGTCETRYSFESKMPFLLIGNVVKTHKILDSKTGQEIFPTNQKSLLEDTWPELLVYHVTLQTPMLVVATYPQTASLKGFAGMAPRQCPDQRVLAGIDILTTSTMMSKIILLAFIIMIFWAAAANRQGTTNSHLYRETWSFFVLGTVTFLASFWLADHSLDAFKPNLKTSQFLLRFLTLIGFSLPFIGALKNSRFLVSTAMVAVTIWSAISVNYSFVVLFSHSTYYQITVPVFVFSALAYTAWSRDFYSMLALSPLLLDAGHLLGLHIDDYPIIYWTFLSTGTYFLKVGWDLGAGSLIPLLWKAGGILRKNSAFHVFSERLNADHKDHLDVSSSSHFRSAMESVPQAIGAMRIGLVFLPTSGQPVTIVIDHSKGTYNFFEDGRIDGNIFPRVIMFKEELWFKTIKDLSSTGFKGLKEKKDLNDAIFFCALPLLYKGHVVGVISATRFDDTKLNGNQSEDYRQLIRVQLGMVVKHLESYLQRKKLSLIESHLESSNQLLKQIDRVYSTSANESQFMREIYEIIAERSKCSILAFRRTSPEMAIVDDSVNLTTEERLSWSENPINLDTTVGNRLGPVVVAFNENKSGYVKRLSDVFDKFHPISKKLLTDLKAESIFAIPVHIPELDLVILLVSKDRDLPISHEWDTLLNSMLPTISASIKSLRRASELEAYGRIASRFIDDAATRSQILKLAEKGELPPTIGKIVEGFIVVVDMVGSSGLPMAPDIKADLYGIFYNDVNDAGERLLGLQSLKKVGDGVILGGDRGFQNLQDLSPLVAFVTHCNTAAKRIGSSGVRVCVHYGKYFSGLIGTKNAGSLDALGTAVDQVCKFERMVKQAKDKGVLVPLAISEDALSILRQRKQVKWDSSPTGHSTEIGSYYFFTEVDSIPKSLIPPSAVKRKKAA